MRSIGCNSRLPRTTPQGVPSWSSCEYRLPASPGRREGDRFASSGRRRSRVHLLGDASRCGLQPTSTAASSVADKSSAPPSWSGPGDFIEGVVEGPDRCHSGVPFRVVNQNAFTGEHLECAQHLAASGGGVGHTCPAHRQAMLHGEDAFDDLDRDGAGSRGSAFLVGGSAAGRRAPFRRPPGASGWDGLAASGACALGHFRRSLPIRFTVSVR